MKITCQSWKSALSSGNNPRYRWTSYEDGTGIELDGASIYNVCAYAYNRSLNDVGDTVCGAIYIVTLKTFNLPTTPIKTITSGDITIESEFTVRNDKWTLDVEGVTFNQSIDYIMNNGLDVTGGKWHLIKVLGKGKVGDITIYFF